MGAQSVQCKVKAFRWITPTVFITSFESLPGFEFKGGQFISVIIPGAGPGGRNLRRAYSIASPPQNSLIELCVKYVEGGPGTTYLKNLKPGDTFAGVAPYGDFTLETPPSRKICFIATGTGIAPFRSMALTPGFAKDYAGKVTCLFGCRTADEVLYEDEMRALGIHWVTALSREPGASSAFRGRCTDYLRANEMDWKQTDFYLCGNGEMIQEIKALLADKGVAKENVFQEKYY